MQARSNQAPIGLADGHSRTRLPCFSLPTPRRSVLMSHHELQLQRSICPITLGQRLPRHPQIRAQAGHQCVGPFDSLAKLLDLESLWVS